MDERRLFSQTVRRVETGGGGVGVPEPPPDLDGIFLSQVFNNSSQNQFSLSQLSSSLAGGGNKRRPADRFVKPPPAKICRETRNPKVGVVSPSAAAPSCRVTRPLFKPPLKPQPTDVGRAREPLPSTPSHPSVARDSGYSSGSRYQSDPVYSPPRAVAAVTPSVSRAQPPEALLSTPDFREADIETPHQPLCLTGQTPGGTEKGLIKLRPVAEIPSLYRDVFSFPYFNVVQSKIFDDVLYSDKAIVLSAPTGSGKTVMFELAIIRILIQQQSRPSSHYKVVYMAPMKALCSERYEDWTAKFGPLGMKCKELTGDTELDDYFELQDVHIVLTTPEKWDSMTRKWRDNKSLVQMVRLFLVDEVHMLNDSSRGATMEAVVSRMKTVESALLRGDGPRSRSGGQEYAGIRFMAASATVPNVEDVAAWLDRETATSVHHSFDDSCRPVRLRKVVLGYPCSDNTSEFKFDLSLNYKLAGIIETYSDRKPTLVFCATRKSVQQSASTLVKEAKFIMNSQHRQRLQARANTLRESKLRELVMSGVGYHHAGLDVHDRNAMEELFLKGDLPVLISTSTLAMGVNLPAHLVVIKSTQHYALGMYQEYSETQVLQMIGRAGRPQFDTSATAVIMTRAGTKRKYEDLIQGNQLVESSLHRNLVEHLNAEIVLETISDVSVALEWVRSTFLYIRVMKNPKHYGCSEGQSREQIENKLQELCLKNLNSLAGISLVTMGPDGFTLKATETGRLMARYCIAFDTMKLFQGAGGAESLEDLLVMLCSSKEFRDVTLRNNEKKTLNTLNKDKNRITVRFPMQGKIKTNEMKVNCLVQAQLGSLSVQDFALNQDIGKIFRSAVRISRCLLEVHWHRPHFTTLLNAVLLAKCCRAKLWENSKHVSKQLTGIGVTLSNALVNAGLVTFQKLEEKNPREIELIVNRHPPFGNQVREAVSSLPKYEMVIDQSTSYKETEAELTITVTLTNREQVGRRGAPAGPAHTCALLVGDADNNVVYKAKISDAFLLKNEQWVRRVDVKRADKNEELSINLISQDFVGLDVQSTYTPFYTGPKRIGRAAVGSENQNEPKRTAPSDRTRTSQTPVLPPNRRPCTHTCNNKNACGHDCCKHGVAVKPSGARGSAVDSLRRDLKQKTDHLPKTPLRQHNKQFGQTKKSSEAPRGLQQFSYQPTQQRMNRHVGRTSVPGSSSEPQPQTSSGWEDIDLCQQRAQATDQWNFEQHQGDFPYEEIEINSSDEFAEPRWSGEHRRDVTWRRASDVPSRGRNHAAPLYPAPQYPDAPPAPQYPDDYLPDLHPVGPIVYDRHGKMTVLPVSRENYSQEHPTFVQEFEDEWDPSIDDFSPELQQQKNRNDTRERGLMDLSAHEYEIDDWSPDRDETKRSQQCVKEPNDEEMSQRNAQEYEINDWSPDFEEPKRSQNFVMVPNDEDRSQRASFSVNNVRQEARTIESAGTRVKVNDLGSAPNDDVTEESVNLDVGCFDLGVSFSDESPGKSVEHDSAAEPAAAAAGRLVAPVKSPDKHHRLTENTWTPEVTIPQREDRAAFMFLPSSAVEEISPERPQNPDAIYDSIFEGIF